MNHLQALHSLARRDAFYRGGTGWANGAPLPPEPWGTGRIVGVGQLNLLPPDLVNGVKELITLNTEDAKKQILAEVDKKGEEAKTRALIGGFAAGVAGVIVGAIVASAVK